MAKKWLNSTEKQKIRSNLKDHRLTVTDRHTYRQTESVTKNNELKISELSPWSSIRSMRSSSA